MSVRVNARPNSRGSSLRSCSAAATLPRTTHRTFCSCLHFTTCLALIMAFANGLLFRRGDREDDIADHIESDTPSDRGTPQPDLSDKRLPGIMHNSYFGQVGSGSSTSSASSGPSLDPLQTPARGSESQSPAAATSPIGQSVDSYVLLSVAPDRQLGAACGDHEKKGDEEALPFFAHERPELPQVAAPSHSLHSFPTPPLSQTPSLCKLSDAGSEVHERSAGAASHVQRRSLTDAVPSISEAGSFVRRASLNPLSSVVTTSNVHAAHFSNPSGRHPSTPASPVVSNEDDSLNNESASVEMLKRLTDDGSRSKSIPPTPTRTSSNTAASDVSDPTLEKNGKASSSETTATQVSTSSTVESVKPPKGKLTVKISGARGLRKSKDPYVVAVFQRNELVSSGPRHEDQDENEDATASPMGGIPIMRTASDSGRAMAIPMKSRQSSNNSSADHRDFKGRPLTSNPTWDTEAVLYVCCKQSLMATTNSYLVMWLARTLASTLLSTTGLGLPKNSWATLILRLD